MPERQLYESKPEIEQRQTKSAPAGHFNQAWIPNLLIACIALIGVGIHSPWIKGGVYKESLLTSETPVGAMDFIEKHSLKGNIFHTQIYGDYLIWRLWPNQRSFIDGRVHLFGESFVRYYQNVLRHSNWEELLKKYDIKYLLLAKGKEGNSTKSIMDTAGSSPSWTMIYEDEQSILYKKRQNKAKN